MPLRAASTIHAKDSIDRYESNKSFIHKGFIFNRTWDGKIVVLYNCRYNRKKDDSCTCKLKILKSDGSLTETGKYDLSCVEKSGTN